MSKEKGKIVIVRTATAGVHVGTLVSRRGKEVVLANAHKIWRWSGANTANDLAASGAGEKSRISAAATEVVLTDAFEILTCSDVAARNLTTPRWSL